MQKTIIINLNEVSEIGVPAKTVFYIKNIKGGNVTDNTFTIETSDKCLKSVFEISNDSEITFTIKYLYLSTGEPYSLGDYWFTLAADSSIESFDIIQGYTGDDLNPINTLNTEYQSIFRTPEFKFSRTSPIDMIIQQSYDGSVNVLFTDDNNPMRIINSKFSVEEGGETATLIKRRTSGATNVYDSNYFHKTTLIPTFKGVPSLSLDNILLGGMLTGGSYIYYLKYADADGLETDIIEESRPVVITSDANTACKPDEITSKTVHLKLSNCDKAFPYVRVYYSLYSGTTEATPVSYKIDKNYLIQEDGNCFISHSGFEPIVGIDISEIVNRYNIINKCKSISIINNRLAVGNVTSKSTVIDYFEKAALNIVPMFSKQLAEYSWTETVESTNLSPYTDAKKLYDYTGYYPDEAYEFGIVGITDQGYTAVYPIHGYHQNSIPLKPDLIGYKFEGFEPTTFQNTKGVFRFPDQNAKDPSAANFFEYLNYNINIKYTPLPISFDISKFKEALLENTSTDIKGFFFVRKHRKPNRILHGVSGKTVGVPIESFPGGEAGITPINPPGMPSTTSSVVGIENNTTKLKFLPYFNNLWPYGHEDSLGTRVNHILKAPQANYKDVGKGYDDSWRTEAFISADIECNANYLAVQLDNIPYIIYKQNELYGKVIESNPDALKESNTAVCRIPNRLVANKIDEIEHIENKIVTAKTSYIPADLEGYTNNSFASKTDKNIFIVTYQNASTDRLSKTEQQNFIFEQKTETSTSRQFSMQRVGGTSVKYSSYVGLRYEKNLKIDNKDRAIQTTSQTETFTTSIAELFDPSDMALEKFGDELRTIIKIPIIGVNSKFKSTQFDELDDFNSSYSYIGSLDYIQQLKSDDPSWINKYQVDDENEYFPISNRISLATKESISTLQNILTFYGGDAYIGTMHKQLWHPLGISEAPQATDINTYLVARRALAMLDYGLAISYPTISSYNFHLRVPENKEQAETVIFGKRSYLPNKGFSKIQGNIQLETTSYNMAYADSRIFRGNPYFNLNSNSQFYAIEYPNRVYASNSQSSTLFRNGFREFLGVSYKDYSPDLGAITKLMATKSTLIIIFQSGVGVAGVDERGLVNVQGGETAFLDNVNTLAPKAQILSDVYGSTQFKSITASVNYIYGVDTVKKAAWRTNGSSVEVISTFKTQSWFIDTETRLLNYSIPPSDKSIGITIKDKFLQVITTYDESTFLITFTYKCLYTYEEKVGSEDDYILIRKQTEVSDTISFNEIRNVWESKLDYHPAGFFNLRGKFYSFGDYTALNKVFEHGNNELLSNYNDVQHLSEFEFVLSDDITSQKILNHMQIISNRCSPEEFTYTVDEYIFNNKTSKSTTDQALERVIKPLQKKYEIHPLYKNRIKSLSLSRPYVGEKITIEGIRYKLTSVKKVLDGIKDYIWEISYEIMYPEKDLTGNMDSKYIYKGHRIPNRMSSVEYEENKWEVFVPKSSGESRIRDKWIKVKISYNGNDPLFVSGIVSDINYSFA